MGARHRAVGQHQLLHRLVPLRLPRLITHPGVTLPTRLQRGLLTGNIGAQALQRARITGHVGGVRHHRRLVVHDLRHHKSLSLRLGRLRSPGSCSPQHCQRPHKYPRHRRGWPARYPAANSPWPPPPQTGHAQPETPPHHHRRKTPATTSLPAPPDQSSTASTPPWRQTPTATPPTAEYVHPEDSWKYLSHRLRLMCSSFDAWSCATGPDQRLDQLHSSRSTAEPSEAKTPRCQRVPRRPVLNV